MRRLLLACFAGVIAAMTAVIVDASLERDVISASRDFLADPWGRALFLDTYFAFFTVWLWIALRERSWPVRLAWLAAICVLGSPAYAAYFIAVLLRSRGEDPRTVLLGRS